MLLPATRARGNPWFYGVLALVIVIGLLASVYVYVQVDHARRASILERAGTVAEAVSPDALKSLSGTDADLSSPEYRKLKDLLVRIRAANHDARFIYVTGLSPDGTQFFYADSEDPSSPDYSPPGQVYDEATPGMFSVFETGTSQTEGPDRDRWGVWISGYAPIRDKDGTVFALLGIDLPANQYLADLLAYSLLPLLLALILATILVATGRAHRRELLYLEQKAEFLSIASHEIRTPLTGIRWAVEGILKQSREAVGPRTRHTLELVHESCLGLLGRVNNLLDLTALESKQREFLRLERISILEFVKDITDSLALSAVQRNVEIVLDSSFTNAGTFFVDRQMMHHAFFNLLTNAIKYTHEGTQVTLSVRKDGALQVFTITDHGDGIPKEEQERIFAGYARTKDAVKSGQYGTGLGLYLARKAAQLHGGDIRVKSVPEEGATFTLTVAAPAS